MKIAFESALFFSAVGGFIYIFCAGYCYQCKQLMVDIERFPWLQCPECKKIRFRPFALHFDWQ